MRFYYDVHLHSCLSPCGDDDMTPNNIAGMGTVNGLQIMALTDHNSTANCPAFLAACKKQGIVGIPGMELTTAEDVHLVCLFDNLSSALSFGEAVNAARVPIANKVKVFGNQFVLDENDVLIRTEENLLPNATLLSLEEGTALCNAFGGVAYPAHIDREANGIIAVLGDMPANPHFPCVEFRSTEKVAEYTEKYKLFDKKVIFGSDAHYLWDVAEPNHYVDLDVDDESYSSARVRTLFVQYLKGTTDE